MPVAIIQGAEELKDKIHYEVDVSMPPIGVGGMGQVMRGVRVDEKTGVREDVAVKFLFSDLPEHAIDRARREASIRIENENLVKMYGFIQIDENVPDGGTIHHYHVVSELLRGVILSDLLKGKFVDADGMEVPFAKDLYLKYKQEPALFSVFVIKKVLSGLMALHDGGYIHRDVDPSNIMILSDGKVKLIDFGIARQLRSLHSQDRQLTSSGQFLGKAGYAAPELVLGDVDHQDETTDIYAVGMMLFQFLTGHLPFEGSINEVMEMQRSKAVPLAEVEPKGFRRIIQRATEKKQSLRYSSAAEFRVELEKLERALTPDPSNDDSSQEEDNSSVPSGRNLKRIVRPAVGIAFLLLFSLAFLLFRNHDEKDSILSAAPVDQEPPIEQAETSIIDSGDPMLENSAGWYTARAEKMLAEGTSVEEAIEILEKIAEKNYVSSAKACALLASMYSHSGAVEAMSIQSPLAVDYRKAHDLNLKACSLDGTCYQALYELGLDCFFEERNVEERDVEKARALLEQSRDIASKKGDYAFVMLVDKMTR